MVQFADAADGVRLAYETAGTGAPGMLFVHGWSCDRSYLAPQVRHFAARHAVAALDLRGHGGSGRPEPEPGTYDVDALAGDALTVARAAGLDRPVVVGHSLGALVALACAARPDLVRAAVLIEPPAMLPGPRKEHYELSVPDVAADHDGSWRRAFFERLFKPADVVRREETLAAANAQPAPVAAAVIGAMGRFDGAGALDRASVPLLVITAGGGERALRDRPGLAFGRTVGAGHFCQLEVPEQVNPMIERFMAINEASGAAG
ncbi:hypothetical protein GCM10023322_27030 [Rugosimonospora acidiphila]|uniref:AB hydrolase-1 domain-containing protein n=1 Tax=Rugosimonospora acidiphila TaxID=556531 RepID=A0ABP9RSL0_9ACTN